MNKRGWSLRRRLMRMVCCFWIVPVILVSAVYGLLISGYYTETIQETMENGVSHAVKQVEMRVMEAIEDSKAVSYDGEVRSSYRRYEDDHDAGALYRTVRDYLARRFSRSSRFEAVHIAFSDENLEPVSYMITPEVMTYHEVQHFRTTVQKKARECAEGSDTGIYFMEDNDVLYMVRNILDGRFEPYATLVMRLNKENLLQSAETIAGVTSAKLTIDGIALIPEMEGAVSCSEDARMLCAHRSLTVDGHEVSFSAQASRMNIWKAIPMLKWAILFILLLLVPLLLGVIAFCHKHITMPVSLLTQASDRVQNGERGYKIENLPESQEFGKLCRHFNAMSCELQNQFERIYEEQQALTQAKVRALQSQIDPHFLNNTLEIINWQARMEGNDRVSAMIEALSTMLGASIGRDGRAQITLREELQYADAYLYIIGVRLGDRLKVVKDIDESLLDQMIPRLMIQPLVENAINHDIADHSGVLCLRIKSNDGLITIDVEHDGHISPKDRERINLLLSDEPLPLGEKSRRVGLRNVHQRIKLLYGERATISIEEVVEGKILARIQLPENVQVN